MGHDPQQAPTPRARDASVWRRYLRFWGPRAEDDVDDELAFHFAMRVRDYMARGMSEGDARAETVRRLGDLRAVRAESISINSRRERRMNRALLVDAFVHDLRFAVRTLMRRKAWTAVTVLTLALGIGANAAVFSVVDAMLLHVVPYPDADRIALVMEQPSQSGADGLDVTISPPPVAVRSWREHARSIEDVQTYATTDKMLDAGDGVPETIHAAAILPSFPRFAGERPLLGRVFSDADIEAGGHVAMLSEAVWRLRFGADRNVLGKVLHLDGEDYTVIGVAPAGLQLPRTTSQQRPDIWLPLDLKHAGTTSYAIARLRPGVSFDAAARELDVLELRSGAWSLDADKKPFTVKLVAPAQMVGVRKSLVMLSGAVALVLLIACANVAHLLLAGAAARQRELAIRSSLGAGTPRLFRQMLTESLVLSVVGCLAGVAVGWVALRGIVALRPELALASMNGQTLAFTALLCLATGLVFGVIGVVQASRHSSHDVLKAGALSTSHDPRQRRARSLLVVSEMALSTILLVGSTLLVRTIIDLRSADPGFEPAGLYTLDLALRPLRDTAGMPARRAVLRDIERRAKAIPGVVAVAQAGGAPPQRFYNIAGLEIDGEAPPPPNTSSAIANAVVEPNFFTVMRLRFVQGGTFTDTTRGANQVIINESFARKHWPGRSALGKRLRFVFNSNEEPWMTIVGVVHDAAFGGLVSDRTEPMLYLASSQRMERSFLVRTRDGANPMPALRRMAMQALPHTAAPAVTSLEDMMASSLDGPRFTMMLLTAFTLVAVFLAAVGLYGVLAYSVAQRTREIGIRIALGASRRRIARSVVSDGVLLVAAGIVIGAVAAFWATKLLESAVHGLRRTDPVAFMIGALLLFGTAVLACVVPMRRAVSVDPAIAMKAD